MKKYSLISFIFVFFFLATSFTPKFAPSFGIKVIVIDAGHGGKDPGCHGSKHNEKDIALAVALKFGGYIEKNLKDVKVVYTRKTDVFVELQERAEIANRAKADLFISIHCNAACYRDKKTRKDVCRSTVQGAETYVMGIKNENGKLNIAKRENSAILLEDDYVEKYEGFDPNSDESYIIMSMFADTYLDQSLNFASKVQEQYSERIGRKNRGVKRASLWVLWRTYMPSVLTEIGYLTNKEEERFLASNKGQEFIASGLFRAFRDYKDELEGTSKKYEDTIEKQGSYVKEPVLVVKPKITETAPATATPVTKELLAVVKVADSAKKTLDTIKTVIYKVQLISSERRILMTSSLFNNIKVPGEYEENGVYKYTAGKFADIRNANNLKLQLRKNGFKDCFVIAMKNGKRIPVK